MRFVVNAVCVMGDGKQLNIAISFCRSMIYGFTSMVHNKNYANFDYQKCLMFGSLISATDPGMIFKNIPLLDHLDVFSTGSE